MIFGSMFRGSHRGTDKIYTLLEFFTLPTIRWREVPTSSRSGSPRGYLSSGRSRPWAVHACKDVHRHRYFFRIFQCFFFP